MDARANRVLVAGAPRTADAEAAAAVGLRCLLALYDVEAGVAELPSWSGLFTPYRNAMFSSAPGANMSMVRA